MTKTVLITGATDGIGRRTAAMVSAAGHRLLLHGRSADKLADTAAELDGGSETYVADLSRLGSVVAMADQVSERHGRIDVLINNAGVFKAPEPLSSEGFDVRFVVNTFAPYLLTRRLLPVIPQSGTCCKRHVRGASTR